MNDWGVRRLTTVFAGVVILTAGCASTKQYAGFAQAGTVYTVAVDRLLVTAGNTGIDATSERLLQDDALKNQDLDSYQKLSSVDVERLAIIGHLRTHAQLLGHYFRLLNLYGINSPKLASLRLIRWLMPRSLLRGSSLSPQT